MPDCQHFTMSRAMTKSVLDVLSYRSLVRFAKRLCLPGNLKKCEYIKVLKLHQMGLDAECKALAYMMKTKKKQAVKKFPTKNLILKKSTGRLQKSIVKVKSLSNASLEHGTEYIQVPEVTVVPVERVQTGQNVKSNSANSEMYPSASSQNIVHNRPISKSTSERLRSVLLSANRSKFNQPTNNDKFYNNFHEETWNNNVTVTSQNSNLFINDSKSATSRNNYQFDLQSFPDIPLLADVDINASFVLNNSNIINDSKNKNTGLFVDDSDTLSNQSVAENTEREQRDIDRRWAMSIRTENRIQSSQFICETLNPLHDASLLGPQDTALVQNDVIQNYIDKNDVHSMKLPDSSCEVIQTLQYYESNVTNQWSSESNVNESILNKGSVENKQLNIAETNNTLVEFASMLPCPIAGCVWHSHSAALYIHLFTCHQHMISYGNAITHVFQYQDIKNFCYLTHLQIEQGTIYIITVAFDSLSHSFFATIQHVSSFGDNTSASSTIAVLSAGFLKDSNDNERSWTGQVQPYSIPLNVLHADGKCLFIDSSELQQCVVVRVNLSIPLLANNAMLTCL